MQTVEVEILGQVITPQYGTLNTGDVLRTTHEFAKHLVEDCAAAKYRKAPPALEVEEVPAVVLKQAPKPTNKSAAKHETK